VKPGFWNPVKFISKGLANGRLLILLDGLDETDSSQRPRAIAEIRELLQWRCNVVLTCRSAAYHGEFDADIDGLMRIREFDDEQVAAFLEKWQADEDPASAGGREQLLRILSDRPQLRALARNPLLLTIIAFLHIDSRLSLPHSRAEFYQQATSQLLEGWKGERNLYQEFDKRRTLESIATQDLADWRMGEPGLTIDRDAALAAVRISAPSVSNASDSNRFGLLREIVERSGLLTLEGRGERFWWAHMTFREYFVAESLRDREGEVLAAVRDDPENWHEIAKLWCGLAKNASSAIRAMVPDNPTLAVDCCSEAAEIDDSLYRELAELIEAHIGSGIPGFERASGTLAARGGAAAILDVLIRLANRGGDKVGLAAATALSYSNSDKGAKELAALTLKDESFLLHLLKMVSQAVSALGALARAGDAHAASIIADVGGRVAAQELVYLLSRSHDDVAVAAAWGLASLSNDPAVESSLACFAMGTGWPEAEGWAWVWSPFPGRDESPGRIMARVAFLISNHPPPARLPVRRLDPRIVVPLCSVHYGSTLQELGQTVDSHLPPAAAYGRSDAPSIAYMAVYNEPVWRQSLERAAAFQNAPRSLRTLLLHIPPVLEFDLIRRVSRYRIPTRGDWERIFDEQGSRWSQPARYVALGVLGPFIAVGAVLALWIALVLLNFGFVSVLHFLPTWSAFAAVLGLVIWLLTVVHKRISDPETTVTIGCGCLPFLVLMMWGVWSLADLFHKSTRREVPEILSGGLAWFIPTQAGFWLLLGAGAALWPAKRLDDLPVRINPLYGVLAASERRARALRWRLAPAPARSPFISLSLRKPA
jgi:hypothetical protein